MKYLEWLWTMSTKHKWVSWICHAVLAFLLSLPFGSVAAGTFYFLREVEQAWREAATGQPIDLEDHWWDFFTPVAAAVLAKWLLGW